MTLAAIALGCEDKKLPTPPAADVGNTSAQVDNEPAEPKVKPNIVKDEGPMPSGSTSIAKAGEFEVTVGDFDEASKISLLFAPDGQTKLVPEQLAAPHVHLTMTRSLLSQKVIQAELDKRGIKPVQSELNAYLRDHPRLGEYGRHVDDPEALAEALEPLGLEPAQLYRVAWDELGNQRLAKAMINEIDDEEIWKTYQFQNTTRTAALVIGRNVPESKSIDDFMGKNAELIDRHFQENQNRYRTPRRVRLHIVRPAPGTTVGKAVLEEAANLLEKGVQPKTVANDLALEFELETPLVRGENPRAFGQRPGEVGWTDKGARGAYAWKVVGFDESRLPEMTRPLRREIAAELMRTTSVVPKLHEKLEKAAKRLAKLKLKKLDLSTLPDKLPAALAKLDTAVEKIDGLTFDVATFPNNPSFPLPNHGLSEEAIVKTYELEVGDTSEPFLSRERGFVVRVLQSRDASREEFDANIDENRRAFIAAVETRIVSQWVESRLKELNATVDVKPLRIKYGVLQKDTGR